MISLINHIPTDRLNVDLLTTADAAFIHELTNTDGWLQFIGNRNINSIEDAIPYIGMIFSNPNVLYRVVRLKNEGTAIGVVTLIKRDYLDDNDIGFAFLPQYTGMGYAYEAATAVIEEMKRNHGLGILHAITVRENHSSIGLLERCGFTWIKPVNTDGEALQLYSLTVVQ